MASPKRVHACALALAFMMLAPAMASAQLGDLRKRITGAVSDQVGQEVEEIVRNGVRCAFRDEACIRKARAENRTPIMTDDDGRVLTDKEGRPITDPAVAAAAAGAAAERPGAGAWVNYDFVPGERLLFHDDFRQETVGDFPRRLELVSGNWEVAEWRGARYLRATSGGAVRIPLSETLPDRFTLEFPASVQHGNAYVRVSTAGVYHGDRTYAGSLPSLEFSQAGLRAHKQGPVTMTRRAPGTDRDALVTVRIMADGAYLKMYVNEQRVANVPNAPFARTNTLVFSVSSASDTHPVMIGPVRIAAGGRDLYDALARDGRVATQGILFAVDSDVIRPESTPTLKAIGDMLTRHKDLRLSIEGHTDADGDDTHNLDLSKRRAAAVKAFLVATYGVETGRLETEGFGETRPVASNSSPEGRQQNRRVELVRQGS
jgi:OmpA-OmpF porin, OOP family